MGANMARRLRRVSTEHSWLLHLPAEFLVRDQELKDIAPQVADSGEGRWTVLEGVALGLPTPVMSLALKIRFASQGKD
jgi:6-phosphogluconate dehydrogenase